VWDIKRPSSTEDNTMLHLAALHAVARPLAVAALAIAGIAGPGLVVAHPAAAVQAAGLRVESCLMAARGPMAASCAASPHGTAMHGVTMGMAAAGRH
jgi:hypothetical protein